MFRKSKTQSIRGFIEQLNEVISFADELIHEETEMQIQNNETFGNSPSKNPAFTHKTLSPEHIINNRKYWPQYSRYSVNHQQNKEDENIARFFTNFSYSDPKLNNELQNIMNSIKKDLNRQEKEMNKEVALSQKNSIELRYKYKMNIEKDNYKRNVKSFLKCKK